MKGAGNSAVEPSLGRYNFFASRLGTRLLQSITQKGNKMKMFYIMSKLENVKFRSFIFSNRARVARVHCVLTIVKIIKKSFLDRHYFSPSMAV